MFVNVKEKCENLSIGQTSLQFSDVTKIPFKCFDLEGNQALKKLT